MALACSHLAGAKRDRPCLRLVFLIPARASFRAEPCLPVAPVADAAPCRGPFRPGAVLSGMRRPLALPLPTAYAGPPSGDCPCPPVPRLLFRRGPFPHRTSSCLTEPAGRACPVPAVGGGQAPFPARGPMFARIALLSAPYSTLTYVLPDIFPKTFWQEGLRMAIPLGRGALRAGIILECREHSDLPDGVTCREAVWPLETVPLLSEEVRAWHGIWPSGRDWSRGGCWGMSCRRACARWGCVSAGWLRTRIFPAP